MLKEARIVMPIVIGSSAHGSMQDALLQAFGGFTSYQGQGQWLDGGETEYDDVIVYDVAAENNVDAMSKLRSIAMTAGQALGQKAVYIRFPDGRVEIVEIVKNLGAERVTPLPGIKRLPQVGEVWESHCGALIAVMTQASVLDGGYNAVSLTAGDSAVQPGRTILLDMDGKMYGGSKGEPRPFDLKLFVKRFTRD